MKRFAVTLVVLGMLVSGAASAETAKQACQTACDEQNVRASCAWLSKKPRRCVRRAIKACIGLIRGGGVPACNLPEDLPPCLTNQGCPYGSMCVDSTCQVVACDGTDGIARCTGDNTCAADRCVVSDCRGSDQNCPSGFHCEPPGGVSGTCQADDPTRRACAADTDCIAPGEFNPRCFRGVCAARRGRRQCQSDADCFRACRRNAAAARIPRCDAAGRCVCANCIDTPQCNVRFTCLGGQNPTCRTGGMCFCPPPPATPSGGGKGFCSSFETPACTPCTTDAECSGIDTCLQSATCG